MRLIPIQLDRAVGALLGSAAGDALGARYEFGPALPDQQPVDMSGSALWEPGEWTDDTAMAIPIAQVLADGGALEDPSSLDRIVAAWSGWSRTAKDVGVQTRSLLSSIPEPTAAAARAAAARQYAADPKGSGGNGTLMRTGPVALGYLDDGQEEALARAARGVSDLTHGDPDAGDACVIWSLAIRHAIRTGQLDVVGQLEWLPAERRHRWAELVAEAEQRQPRDFHHNGWVVEALQGAWSAITHGQGLVDVLERAVRGGKDTDTVAAIAGALAGAVHGGAAVPARWRRILHGWPGLRARDLVDLAVLAVRQGQVDDYGWPIADQISGYGLKTLVAHPFDDGVLLASIDALPSLPDDVDTVVSLCRIGRHQTDREHIEFWLVDAAGQNADVDGVLSDAADTIATLRAEGRRVAVHCVEARSRTAAVALLYAVRHRGASLAEAEAALRQALPDYAPKQFLLDAADRLAGQGQRKGATPRPSGIPTSADASARSEGRTGADEEMPVPPPPEPATRFVIAQSWWIAAELARRNGLLIYEMHPGGGMYDVLAVTGIEDGELASRHVALNRAGRIHIHPDGIGWKTWQDVLAAKDPHAVVHEIEDALDLHPDRKPTTSRQALTYRVAARVLASLVDDRHEWDVRMAFLDSSSDWGLDDAPRFPLAGDFNRALEHARTLPSTMRWGEPLRHLWVLGHGLTPGLSEAKLVAVMSDDAHVFLPKKAPVDLMALYRANDHRLGATIHAALGAVIP